MKALLISIASALLLFNGIGALYGGWNFINEPDGSSMKMSTDWLKNSPFDNYLIPGIILFVVNGIFSLSILIALWLKYRHFALLIMMQGVILTGWILIQVLLIQTIIPLHFIMGAVGIALFIVGWALLKTNQTELKSS